MIERATKIVRQANKFLNSYAKLRNNAKLFNTTNLITR